MRKFKSYRLFQFFIMAYLVAAFSWWAILLLKENRALYEIKKDVVFANQDEMQAEIRQEFERTRLMIIGEGFVFAISILVSFYLVNRAFWTEIKANKKQNNFLLSITHELKTPIASLKLINDTLRKKEIPREKQVQFLQSAHEEALRLESLVNNILTVTQMDNDYHYNFEETDLIDVVYSRKKRFQLLFPHAIIRIEADKPLPAIEADREALIKVIDNLIDNAIKYSDIEAHVTLRLENEDGKVILSVEDNGRGIPEEEREKILDKFYRIGNESQRDSKGTGLGLFIVKEICRVHNAEINVKDNAPKGSIFKISFPA